MATFERRNHLESLPSELKFMLIKSLSKKDLCNLALASKVYKPIVLDPSRWQDLTINQHNAQKLNKEGLGSLLAHSKRFNDLKIVDNCKIRSKIKGKTNF